MASFSSIMKDSLTDFSECDEKITGFVDSKEEWENIVEKLQVLGYSYSVRHSYSIKKAVPQPLFHLKKKEVSIDFLGSPFVVDKVSYMQCVHGPNYFKQHQVKKPHKDPLVPKKTRHRLLDTKKLGCEAKITVRQIRIFPEFSLTTDTRRRRKEEISKKLKAAFSSAEKPQSYQRFYVACSSESTHNHSNETSALCQKLSKGVMEEIKLLVESGITSVKDIKFHIKRYVSQRCNDELKPAFSNSAFYPSNEILYSHVSKNLLALKKSSIYQDAIKSIFSTVDVEYRPSDKNPVVLYVMGGERCVEGQLEDVANNWGSSSEANIEQGLEDHCIAYSVEISTENSMEEEQLENQCALNSLENCSGSNLEKQAEHHSVSTSVEIGSQTNVEEHLENQSAINSVEIETNAEEQLENQSAVNSIENSSHANLEERLDDYSIANCVENSSKKSNEKGISEKFLLAKKNSALQSIRDTATNILNNSYLNYETTADSVNFLLNFSEALIEGNTIFRSFAVTENGRPVVASPSKRSCGQKRKQLSPKRCKKLNKNG